MDENQQRSQEMEQQEKANSDRGMPEAEVLERKQVKAPAKPLSAFMLFMKSLKNDQAFKERLEKSSIKPNFLQEATKMWQEGDEAYKAKFNQEAEHLRAQYKIELEAYNEARKALGEDFVEEDDEQKRK